jgi:hypothetical protein
MSKALSLDDTVRNRPSQDLERRPTHPPVLEGTGTKHTNGASYPWAVVHGEASALPAAFRRITKAVHGVISGARRLLKPIECDTLRFVDFNTMDKKELVSYFGRSLGIRKT